MASRAEPVVRDAEHDDVAAICRFGEAHIRPHYAPLIGAEAADEQVRRWWNETHLGAAVAEGLVVVAEADGQLVGVGQRGRRGADHVVYKLYVHPEHRGRGLGPQVLAAITTHCPLTLTGCMSNISSPTSARVRSMSVRASPWSGSKQVLPETLPSGSCGVPAIWRHSNKPLDERDAGKPTRMGLGLRHVPAADARPAQFGRGRPVERAPWPGGDPLGDVIEV